MSRQPTRPSQDAKKPPQKSAKHSSEIDVDEVLKLAREADEQAKAEPEPPRARRKKDPATGGQVVEFARPIEPDPEFIEMCKWGVGSVADIAVKKFDWSDPGIHWKEKVSTIVARIIQRLQPMEPSLTTDLIILSGYTALWAIPNVEATIAAKRAAKNKNALGNDRERENVQNAGATDAA